MSRTELIQYKDFPTREVLSVFVSNLNDKQLISIETIWDSMGEKYRVWWWL